MEKREGVTSSRGVVTSQSELSAQLITRLITWLSAGLGIITVLSPVLSQAQAILHALACCFIGRRIAHFPTEKNNGLQKISANSLESTSKQSRKKTNNWSSEREMDAAPC